MNAAMKLNWQRRGEWPFNPKRVRNGQSVRK